MGHATIKALLISEIVKMISQKWEVSEEEALDMFYTSKTLANLSDDETSLYGQSALFIFGMYCQEAGKDIF